VKLAKGEGRATRARALDRLAAPGRAMAVAVAVACRIESSRDRDRDREAYALFLSFMSVIHVNHNLMY
jgi:hypothetical protein